MSTNILLQGQLHAAPHRRYTGTSTGVRPPALGHPPWPGPGEVQTAARRQRVRRASRAVPPLSSV
eukprot:364100-Chlamydomonas_euryale.AAC.49